MFYNEANWYTDDFDIYRNVSVEVLGVTKEQRKLIQEHIRGRIYSKKTKSLDVSEQAYNFSVFDMLACRNDVDIKPGDELVIRRGYYINQFTNGNEEKYIAGNPTKYMMPVGGISIDISHQEVSIQAIRYPKDNSNEIRSEE